MPEAGRSAGRGTGPPRSGTMPVPVGIIGGNLDKRKKICYYYTGIRIPPHPESRRFPPDQPTPKSEA